MTTPTLRRLDDRERYWGMSWPGWVAAIAGAGALYLAIKLSPLPTKPTITITIFVLALVAMVFYGVSGQALSPGRQLLAIISYRRSPKLREFGEHVERRGLVLDAIPELGEDDQLVGQEIEADQLRDEEADDWLDDDWSATDDQFVAEEADDQRLGEHTETETEQTASDSANDDDHLGETGQLSGFEELWPADPLSGQSGETESHKTEAAGDSSDVEPGGDEIAEREDL